MLILIERNILIFRTNHYLLFLKWKYDSIPIGKKYKHQISRAITPPIEPDALWLANIPVIGIIKQLIKNIPCINNKYFNALS